MQITRLDSGQSAPDNADRVRITKITQLRYRWGGSVAYSDSGVFKDCPDEYASYDEAERDAITWAAHHNVEHLIVETDSA